MKFKNFWLGEPATIREILVYRKAAGYTVKEDVDRWFRRTGVWWVLACIPRIVKTYVIVEASSGTQGNPGEVTAIEMMKRIEARG